MVILLWLISAENYALTRKFSGCSHLQDLTATKEDNKSILEMADRMGIPDEYRWIDIDPTY